MHQQLACVQTPPPPLPSEKKNAGFLKRGASVHGLAAASLAIQSLRRRQPNSTDESSCNAGNWAKRGFPFSASNSGEANSRNFRGQVEYFFYVWSLVFVADSLSDENFATLR